MQSQVKSSFLFILAALIPAPAAFAQLPRVKVDPLRPAQSAPGTAACSATETSSCAEAAVKLLPLILGDSPMLENLRRLTDEVGGRVTGTPEMAKAVQWGIAGFRAAGVEVHAEKYMLPVTWKEGATRLAILSPSTSGAVLRAVAEGWGTASPRGGIEGRVVDLGDGTDA